VPIESADDLAVFFSPEEFGEAIIYNGVGGFSGIWDGATGDAQFGDTQIVVETNIMHLPATQVPAPVPGDTIELVASGDAFVIIGEPRRSRDRALWVCELDPTNAPARP
jgi:hypothetical protein